MLHTLLALPCLLAPALLDPQWPADGDEPSLDRDRAHYARVEEELRSRDVAHLSPERRAARSRIVAALRAYRQRGAFTRLPDELRGREGRVPLFVDEAGRRCAVANLLHVFGEDDLVERVARENNRAWVLELEGDAEFRRWLDEVGLSLEEAARVQVPSVGGGPAGGPTGSSPGAPPTYGGPAAGPSAPNPSGPSTPAPGPLGPGTPRSPGLPPSTPISSAPAGPFSGSGLQDWALWWELNKLAWMRPRPLEDARAPDDGRTRAESWIEGLRRTSRGLFEEHLAHVHPEVRAAAALTYGRVAGASGMARLVELLADPSQRVRHAAILALAATESEKGVHALLTLIGDGRREVSPLEDEYALVALGVARAKGVAPGVDRELATLLAEDCAPDLAFALAAHQAIAPSDALRKAVRLRSEILGEACGGGRAGSAPIEARARAIEALRFDDPREVRARLFDALGSRSLQVRRSAALALGGVEGGLPPLQTAYELEEEPLARAFALLSIGEHGGEDARAFLEREIADGPRQMRTWAALALGALAGSEDDGAARDALRRGLARERNVERRGAFLVALGIARDAEAFELIRDLGLRSKNPRTRGHAAVALGLAGGERSREALRKALAAERSPLARSAIAQGLALRGDPADAPLLLALLDDLPDPIVRGQVAVALGFHGTRPALEGLLARLADEDLPALARAAAVDAAGLLLASPGRLELGEVSIRSNFTAFPWWVADLLQHTL